MPNQNNLSMTLPEPYFQNFNGNSGQSNSTGSHYGLISPPLNDSTSHNIQAQQPQYIEHSHWMPNHYSNEGEQTYYAPRQPEHHQLATPLPSPSYLHHSEPQQTDYYAPQVQHEQVQLQNQWQPALVQQEIPIIPQAQKAESETSFEMDQEYGSRKPFISKLGYLLRNPELFADVIQWNQTGTVFILAPSARFTGEVLPEIFSHSSVSAFTRQLNTYAFRHLTAIQLAENFAYSPDTITPIKELSAWSHPQFLRDQPTLANRMQPTPSRARAAHQLAKHSMLMAKGTSVKPRAPKVPKEKAPSKKRKGQNQESEEVLVEGLVGGDIYHD